MTRYAKNEQGMMEVGNSQLAEFKKITKKLKNLKKVQTPMHTCNLQSQRQVICRCKRHASASPLANGCRAARRHPYSACVVTIPTHPDNHQPKGLSFGDLEASNSSTESSASVWFHFGILARLEDSRLTPRFFSWKLRECSL